MKNLFARISASFRTKAFRVGGYSTFISLGAVAIIVAVNLLVSSLPDGFVKFDVTNSRIFSLSDQTKSLVSELDDDVTITYLVTSGDEDTYIEEMLNRYESLNKHITVEKKDPNVYAGLATEYTDSLTNNSLLVRCGERGKYVDYGDIFVADYTNYYTTSQVEYSFNGENALTGAITYVTSDDLPKLYILTGHGDATIGDGFVTGLSTDNIISEELNLLSSGSVPEDAACVLIFAPSTDLSEKELDALTSYSVNGGSVILMTDYTGETFPNLAAFTEDLYGLSAINGIVVEGDMNMCLQGYPHYLLPDLEYHEVTTSLYEGGYYVLAPLAHGIEEAETENVIVSPLLTSSDSSYLKVAGYEAETTEREDDDLDGPFLIGAAAERTTDDVTSKFIWFSTSYIADDTVDEMVSGSNRDLFLNSVGWLCGETESALSIRAKDLSASYLTMSSLTSGAWSLFVVAVLPSAFLITGIVIWKKRRSR